MYSRRTTIVLLLSTLLVFNLFLTGVFAGLFKYSVFTTAGQSSYGSEDGDATSNALFNTPMGVCTLNDLVYVVDTFNSKLRRIQSSTVSTVAGAGGSGDADGDATSTAKFNQPRGCVVLSNGDVVIADTYNNKIRKLSGTTVSTVAGSSEAGTADGASGSARFYQPSSVAVDSSSNIYVADAGNNCVRKIAASDSSVSTLSGVCSGTSGDAIGSAGDARFKSPSGLAVVDNVLYVADSGNNKIKAISLTDGSVTHVSGTGSTGSTDGGSSVASFNSPRSLTYDSNAHLFVADANTHIIRKLNINTKDVETIAGSSGQSGHVDSDSATGARFSTPTGVAYSTSANSLYIADSENHRVRRIGVSCQDNVLGSDCDLYVCNGKNATNPSVCSSHGSCTGPATCTCDTNYAGSDCENPKCFGYASTNTAMVCSGHGTCNGVDSCTCQDGYTGDRCESWTCNGVDRTSTSVCGGKGTCTSKDTCSCNTGYSGSICDEFSCFTKSKSASDVCGGQGTCTAPDTCSCNSNYVGSQCQNPKCNNVASTDSSVCGGHGTCDGVDTCTCSTGWQGSTCTVTTCSGTLSTDSSVCGGHGACSSPDTCACETNWGGSTCSSPKCFGTLSTDSSVCGGHGTCTGVDTCSCSSGWTGTDCSKPTCFGVASDSSSVCNGRGTCSGVDTCSCATGFSGDKCQHATCGGVSGSDSSVCSGHGSCFTTDSCSCSTGYSGSNCNDFSCFSKSKSASDVCGGHGTCTAPDTCSCSTGYSGSACGSFSCGGVSSTDSSVCGGHGTCSSPDTCSCSTGWTGSSCSTATCFGVASTDSSVCNGHGTCTGVDTCSCSSGYSGSSCSSVVPTASITIPDGTSKNSLKEYNTDITVTVTKPSANDQVQIVVVNPTTGAEDIVVPYTSSGGDSHTFKAIGTKKNTSGSYSASIIKVFIKSATDGTVTTLQDSVTVQPEASFADIVGKSIPAVSGGHSELNVNQYIRDALESYKELTEPTTAQTEYKNTLVKALADLVGDDASDDTRDAVLETTLDQIDLDNASTDDLETYIPIIEDALNSENTPSEEKLKKAIQCCSVFARDVKEQTNGPEHTMHENCKRMVARTSYHLKKTLEASGAESIQITSDYYNVGVFSGTAGRIKKNTIAAGEGGSATMPKNLLPGVTANEKLYVTVAHSRNFEDDSSQDRLDVSVKRIADDSVVDVSDLPEDDPIILTFPNREPTENSVEKTECEWETGKGKEDGDDDGDGWSKKGTKTHSVNSATVACESRHLTVFRVKRTTSSSSSSSTDNSASSVAAILLYVFAGIFGLGTVSLVCIGCLLVFVVIAATLAVWGVCSVGQGCVCCVAARRRGGKGYSRASSAPGSVNDDSSVASSELRNQPKIAFEPVSPYGV